MITVTVLKGLYQDLSDVKLELQNRDAGLQGPPLKAFLLSCVTFDTSYVFPSGSQLAKCLSRMFLFSQFWFAVH